MALIPIWTVSRAHVSAGAAYQKLTLGFAILFVFALASGLWLLWFLQRWSRRVHGETEQRLHTLAVWHEAPFFSERELGPRLRGRKL